MRWRPSSSRSRSAFRSGGFHGTRWRSVCNRSRRRLHLEANDAWLALVHTPEVFTIGVERVEADRHLDARERLTMRIDNQCFARLRRVDGGAREHPGALVESGDDLRQERAIRRNLWSERCLDLLRRLVAKTADELEC